MSAVQLLGQAQRILNTPAGQGLSSRLAAFLARQALEQIVEQRCEALDAAAPYASIRSKLLILRSLDTAEAADCAALSWNRLSVACHVHAYELQPSVAEIRQICGEVASLLPAT